MGFIRRIAYTLRKLISFLVFFSSFVLLCMLHYISARLQGLPINWICSYSLQLWNPIIKRLQRSRGLGKWSWTVSWTCRLTTDASEWICETAVWFGVGRNSVTKYFMETLSAQIMVLLGRLLWSGEFCQSQVFSLFQRRNGRFGINPVLWKKCGASLSSEVAIKKNCLSNGLSSIWRTAII